MTDLRTSAKAVLELYDADCDIDAQIEALRQALAEPVEPMDALIAEAIEKHDEKNVLIRTVNMRTQAQPYLDALIAEIDRLHRYNFFNNGVLVFDEVEVEAILDKYRSVK